MAVKTERLNVILLARDKHALKQLAEQEGEAMAVVIRKLIRKAAKQEKNYQEADRIRKSLSDQGIELIDKPGGLTDWRLI